MADEVQGSVRGPNGERFELRLGSRSIGVTSRDLILFAFVCGVFVVVYLSHQQTRDTLFHIRRAQQEFQETQYRALADVKAQMQAAQDDMRERVQAGTAAVRDMLAEQDKLLADQNVRVDAQTDELAKMLLMHEFNQDKAPGDRLPLPFTPKLFIPHQEAPHQEAPTQEPSR